MCFIVATLRDGMLLTAEQNAKLRREIWSSIVVCATISMVQKYPHHGMVRVSWLM